eukprot:GHUV01020734.1.p1 GENE.GHUV01020734.1~~GHUV01020734.1.p1  ORF type:complete len:137 (+),score=21.13 GHUV01020734.1:233-643(+)
MTTCRRCSGSPTGVGRVWRKLQQQESTSSSADGYTAPVAGDIASPAAPNAICEGISCTINYGLLHSACTDFPSETQHTTLHSSLDLCANTHLTCNLSLSFHPSLAADGDCCFSPVSHPYQVLQHSQPSLLWHILLA